MAIGGAYKERTATIERPESANLYRRFFKRFFDILISLTALIVFSPIMLFLAVTVRFALGSPVIFRQVRPGKNGKLFYIYKFRTMTDKKDKDGNLLPDEKRVTKFSKFLRKTSLDELPQIFNILKGDMSLIGPRPRLVKDAVFYDDFKSLAVRPGMTGKSQVYGRNNNSWEQVFDHDADYAAHVSFLTDLKIFFLTFPALLRSRQSEKSANKYYPDECFHTGKINESQYKKGLAVAEKVLNAFTERGEQLLGEEVSKFRIEAVRLGKAENSVAAPLQRKVAVASFRKVLVRRKHKIVRQPIPVAERVAEEAIA